MPRNRRPELYALRKSTGVPLTTSYTQYTMEGLIAELQELGVDYSHLFSSETKPTPEPVEEAPQPDLDALKAAYNAVVEEPEPDTVPLDEPVKAQYPMNNQADPEELPSQRLNTALPDDVIRVDDEGRMWYQEEVQKPAYPKPRGRRVLKYVEHGVKTETVQNGEYIETFEIAGEGPGRPAEVKITLPSYQVGIYKDPRFPFKIHCYNGREGFALFEVHEFYGGAELVPEMCKRIYIENDLCYDIRSVIRAIQAEHRQLQLTGRIA